MKLGEAFRAINRHGALPACVLFAFGMCLAAHRFATFKMELTGRQFKLMDPQTVRNMALIDFVGNHCSLAVAYFVFLEALLLYLALRQCPRWSSWLVFGALIVPFCMYFFVCAHIAGKLL